MWQLSKFQAKSFDWIHNIVLHFSYKMKTMKKSQCHFSWSYKNYTVLNKLIIDYTAGQSEISYVI